MPGLLAWGSVGNMVDYSAQIRFDSGTAVVQTGTNTFRIAEGSVDAIKQTCPTELILGALGS